jgi:hypothetical protein
MEAVPPITRGESSAGRQPICGYIYTELYDVEHEIVGIYTAERKLKELGCHPAQMNAETVIIFDHIPLKPGLDYLATSDRVTVGLLSWREDQDGRVALAVGREFSTHRPHSC